MRALRATIVVPGLFALTFKVIGDTQMALFAVFGAFATLVLASFGGTRRDKAVAHLGLAVTGSVVLVIGTVISGTVWLAAVVTVPVAFAIFFAGVAGPNAASGVTAALLAYVLPVASAGTAADIPSRLAGWWLASVVSTSAVLLLSPRTPGDRLRAAAAAVASALAGCLTAALSGAPAQAARQEAIAAKHTLMNIFAATPYRPTGLATADQGLANVVELLEWCTSLISDTLDGHADLREVGPADRELLGAAAALLEDVSWLLGNQDITRQDVMRDIGRLERARADSAARCWDLSGEPASVQSAAAIASAAEEIAVATRGAAADALIAARRADPLTVAAQRRSWYAAQEDDPQPPPGRFAGLAGAARLVARHATPRSALFRSSARGAVALAAAVAVADLSSVQHGFWVVLGTLSVLRTNAASTGSTVWRALLGTLAGFGVGAALLLAIGTEQSALWAALPIAVAVAAYAPGTAPFAVGQAAFTITVVVLFNLLVPAGWTVGLLRIEDVAIGCAVSLVVGGLFWPRGAGAAVGDDLADAFRLGAAYLTQAVDWSLGLRQQQPDTAVAAATAGIRLDDALRMYLAEQGTKLVPKQDLWRLVMGTMRLRLTATSVAALRHPGAADGAARLGQAGPASAGLGQAGQAPAGLGEAGLAPAGPGEAGLASAGLGEAGQASAGLRHQAAGLAGFYERVADEVGPPRHSEPAPVLAPALPGVPGSDGPGSGDAAAGGDGAGSGDAAAGADGAGIGYAAGSVESARDQPRTLWIGDQLLRLGQHAGAITAPAEHLAEQRRVPWWR
jgi:uncharacterized membrane protein YccC